MTSRRVRLASLTSGLALAATTCLLAVSPAQAEPDIGDVEARIDRLYREAEQASERFNEARIQLRDLREQLGSVRADERRAGRDLDAVRADARDAILRQYSGGPSALAELVESGDAETLLERMSTQSSYQQLQRGVLDDYGVGLDALELRREATSDRLEQVEVIEQRLADEKETIDERVADAEALLEELKEEERQELLSRSSGISRLPSDVPASGRAAAAVQYALAQVGDSYVWGAEGPDAFDCSGLTLMAWAQAGVSLPHSSAMQFNSGTRVAQSDLQPGDLVFFYSPISHVGMYIGNGMMVHASNPSTGVKISPMSYMPYVGAVRPG